MQLDLWPEEIKIRDIDRVDISTLKDLNVNKNSFMNQKSWEFKDFPKGKYFVYKTGGINPFLPEEGRIFPYLLNATTAHYSKGGLITPTLTTPIKYPRWNIRGVRGKPEDFAVLISCHVLVATAFIEQEFTTQTNVCHRDEKKNDYHLWYDIPSLKWGTPSQNRRETDRNKFK